METSHTKLHLMRTEHITARLFGDAVFGALLKAANFQETPPPTIYQSRATGSWPLTEKQRQNLPTTKMCEEIPSCLASCFVGTYRSYIFHVMRPLKVLYIHNVTNIHGFRVLLKQSTVRKI